jgi:hypothetical protein
MRKAKVGLVRKEEAAAFFDNWRHRQPMQALDWAVRTPFSPAELGLHRVLHLLAESGPADAVQWLNSHPNLKWRDEGVLILVSAIRSQSGNREVDAEPLQPWVASIRSPHLRQEAERLIQQEPSSIDFDTGLLRIRWDLPTVVTATPPLVRNYLPGDD